MEKKANKPMRINNSICEKQSKVAIKLSSYKNNEKRIL